ncbi:ORF989 [White spot syndrome virus]|uniref:Wsv309 n=3 Tax=White spot syndrome virus TaxID=342409 RepID=Q8VAT1_WSSVS|nr:wsv309 [Shrimp white spot syndrome virus]AFX59686.1 wsv309 [White spot syndrome virus]AAL33311.1 wsv309 [Shrimp white spot syndrome virus]AAL89233.1 WSSV365 [Shrimp white spot syndrome virus]ATU83690.1 ORF989 [White spot syndrome virus]AWQ60440.1 wsv309 [Shrimp white spot syndrome virus]
MLGVLLFMMPICTLFSSSSGLYCLYAPDKLPVISSMMVLISSAAWSALLRLFSCPTRATDIFNRTLSDRYLSFKDVLSPVMIEATAEAEGFGGAP